MYLRGVEANGKANKRELIDAPAGSSTHTTGEEKVDGLGKTTPDVGGTELDLSMGGSGQVGDGDPTHDGYNNLSFDVTELDSFCHDILEPAFPNFTSHSLPSTQPSGQCTSTSASSDLWSPQSIDQIKIKGFEDGNDLRPGGGDCRQKAQEILASLSSLSLHGGSVGPIDDPSFGKAPISATHLDATTFGLPLDHKLRLIREASERLAEPLKCSCATNPQLALLHASIITSILNWYLQAACGVPKASPCEKPATTWHGMNIPTLFMAGFSPTGNNSESNSGSGTGYFGTTTQDTQSLSQVASGVTPASVNIAIGSFNVDDQRVQTALIMQLLSGEVRKFGEVIDQFVSRNSDGGSCVNGGPGGASVSRGLHQTLSSWLREEHVRVSEMMRARLRDLIV
ncbi:hypothetical protein VP1G_00640 [Cytospora mali]|uniref:Aflatoxin regulatory protein domain-containing protein n=1 Tax=Cytospora mali TaxID=578113 RepID=A0A194UNM7_CYTMA|nr:hypothetical protein VP1G_00640 [Valsa mali var. pyri (nom. inval.)]